MAMVDICLHCEELLGAWDQGVGARRMCRGRNSELQIPINKQSRGTEVYLNFSTVVRLHCLKWLP